MIFLIGSIICSTYLTIAFKLCDRFGINKFQAILFNYLTCVITGSFVNGAVPAFINNSKDPWFIWAVIMGFGFVLSFNLIALTVQKNGLAIASVASKLSLVIPFLAAYLLYAEPISLIQTGGLVLALIAVVFTLYPQNSQAENQATLSGKMFFLPLVVFVLTGFLDSMVKYVEKNFLNGANNNEYLVMTFISAFLGGLILFIYHWIREGKRLEPLAIPAGILIGIPNYFSIWFLMKVLKMFPGKSAVILPVNNMGIVLLGAVVAGLIFKEHLRRINWMGIVIAILSICMIAFG